ncbi:hypothetical protein KCU77_g194, partial [Aureobasidium melanogenum]
MAEYQHSSVKKERSPGTDFEGKLKPELIKPQKTQLIRDANGEYKRVSRQMLLAAGGEGQLEARCLVSLHLRKSIRGKGQEARSSAGYQQPISVNTAFVPQPSTISAAQCPRAASISQPVACGSASDNPATPTLTGVGVVGLSWVGVWLVWAVQASGEASGGTGGLGNGKMN